MFFPLFLLPYHVKMIQCCHSCFNSPMNWHLSRLCLAVLFGLLCFTLFGGLFLFLFSACGDFVTDYWTMRRSFISSLLRPLNLQTAMYALLWGDIGLARNMCKFQPHKPGPTQTPCAPPVRELWVACSATQELPTRPSYAPKTLEQKRKSVGTKKAVLEVLGQKKFTLDTQVTHWHTASKRCQPA